MYNNQYKGKRVFLTGHTGFKGSWLAYWLNELGAEVQGYSLAPNTEPSHYKLLNLDIRSKFADIRDIETLKKTVAEFNPEIVFHLAAQPLVRLSYENPIETYETNVMGTLNVFEACRHAESVKAIINITSDKCYENKEWVWGYRENDPMGGADPYSSSKGCAEILTSSYRHSYFNPSDYGQKHETLLASCRAGNVIGGGDWAADRLITDIMASASKGEKVQIRNPHSTRPWQHILDPLSGYLALGQKLLEKKDLFAAGWNFGPSEEGALTVEEVVKKIKKYWNTIEYEIHSSPTQPHEAKLLKLDCSKANLELGWRSVWKTEDTFKYTADWYRDFYENNHVHTHSDFEEYITKAEELGLSWIK